MARGGTSCTAGGGRQAGGLAALDYLCPRLGADRLFSLVELLSSMAELLEGQINAAAANGVC
jgi:hypothetical protein